MPFGTHSGEDTGAFETASSTAGVMQITTPVLPVPVPVSIAGSGNWNSGLILSDGFKVICVGVIATQAGTVTIQRYMDIAGNIPIGTLASATLVANVANTVTVGGLGTTSPLDNLPFLTFTVIITNSAGSTMTLTQVSFLMNAN